MFLSSEAYYLIQMNTYCPISPLAGGNLGVACYRLFCRRHIVTNKYILNEYEIFLKPSGIVEKEPSLINA